MNISQRIISYFLFLCFSFVVSAQTEVVSTKIIHDLNSGDFELKMFEPQKNTSDNSAIYFETDNKKRKTGRIILNLSTLNREEVSVEWQNYSGRIKNSRWSVKLQYRLSENDEWKDVTDSRSRPCEFYTAKRAVTKNFSEIILPQECNNQPHIQIAWKLSYIRGKGTAPNIQTRKIKVSSLLDPYNGIAADITLFRKNNKSIKQIDRLNFNHIPLPYTYPESIRLKLEGKYMRDVVKFEISGANKEYFSVDVKSLDLRQSSKNLTVTYAPKKEGNHKAVLTLKSRRLANDITIPLEGSCEKLVGFDNNLIKDENLSDEEVSFVARVFSNKEYQFRMKVEVDSNEATDYSDKYTKGNIFVTYKWYRDNVCMMTMEDEVKSKEYCVPLQSPITANKIEIIIHNIDKEELSDLYFGFPKAKRMICSGDWNNPDVWEPKGEPNMEDFVYIEDSCKVRVTNDVVCSMLTLGDNVNIEIEQGKMFYVSGDIVYGKRSYFTVHQNLLPERWNYISSPINQARALIYSMVKSENETWLMKYNTGVVSKHGDHWSEYLVDPNFILKPGLGYAVYTHDELDVKYEGILCNSNTMVTLVSNNNDKWNLVGNPFTAPLSTKKLFEDIDGRIQGNAIFLFDHENLVYNPIIVDENEEVMILPLESFFVETMEDGKEITFKRKHQYIPKSGTGSLSNQNFLSLSAQLDGKEQYALMGMIKESSYGFDEYDAHKMFGISEEMPEIYFIVGQDELSVNTFPDYPAVFDVGIYIGADNTIELQMNNLSVLPKNISILLEDRYEGKFYDFCLPNKIRVDLNSGTTADRFRIHLNKAINIYEIHPDYSGIYLWNDNNRIMVYGDGTHHLQTVRVYDKNRNMVGEQEFSSNVLLFDQSIEKGRYTVDIQVEGVWIKDFIVEVK
jgi:hypothetical protein